MFIFFILAVTVFIVVYTVLVPDTKVNEHKIETLKEIKQVTEKENGEIDYKLRYSLLRKVNREEDILIKNNIVREKNIIDIPEYIENEPLETSPNATAFQVVTETAPSTAILNNSVTTEFSEEDMFVLKEDSVLIMEEQTISPDDIGTADGECDFDASEVYNPYLTEQIEEEEIKNEYNSSWAEVMDDYKAQKEKEEKEEEYVVTDHIQL